MASYFKDGHCEKAMKLNFNKQDVKHVIEVKLKIGHEATKETNVWYFLDGRKVLRVTYPKGRGPLTKGTAHSILNQLRLNPSQFSDLVKCPMSAEDYEAHIRTLHLI